MPNVGHENQPTYTNFLSGVVTIGGTEVQLTALAGVSGTVTLRAASANSGTVTIGTTGLSSLGGFTLAAGQQSPPIQLNNAGALYAIASASSQKIEYFTQY
jgi:hypothetical protein